MGMHVHLADVVELAVRVDGERSMGRRQVALCRAVFSLDGPETSIMPGAKQFSDWAHGALGRTVSRGAVGAPRRNLAPELT